MRNEIRKQIYFFGSLWNLAFAASGIALPKIIMWLVYGSTKAITGVARSFFFFFWVLVGLFGWGYYQVSRDPDQNKPVIWMGSTAKVIIFLTFLRHFLRKEVTLFGFLAATGDFIWTLLFLAAQMGSKSTDPSRHGIGEGNGRAAVNPAA